MDTSALNLTRAWIDEHLREALQRTRETGHDEWFAKSLAIPAIDLVEAFSRFSGFAWLFLDPHGEAQLGLGLEREWQWSSSDHLERMETHISRLESQGLPGDLMVVGGQGFDDSSAWPAWPQVYFALPAVQVRQTAHGAHLTVVQHLHPDQPLEFFQQRLEPLWRALLADSVPAIMPQPMTIRSIPNRLEWTSIVEEATEKIRAQHMDKVVLARSLALSYQKPIPVARVLENLENQNPEAVVFALKREQAVFLGASPELLVRVHGAQVETMALAGSAPRGVTPEADFEIAESMQEDAKSQREHAVVKEHIRRALEETTDQLSMSDRPNLKKLPSVQHLLTPIRARLRDDSSLWPIVAHLHPTPAVAGHPVDVATRYIREHEPFNRGWYAGAIGWSTLSGAGHWMVSLRSGLITGREALLYAGCGIMGDSDPESELRESDWKLSTMLSALEIEGGAF